MLNLKKEADPPFSIEVRPRVMDKNRMYIVVQIENNTGKRITHLEGFISKLSASGKRTAQRRLSMIRRADPDFAPGHSLSRGLHYPYSGTKIEHYIFEISKLKFFGDRKIYTYHPAAGFIRIDWFFFTLRPDKIGTPLSRGGFFYFCFQYSFSLSRCFWTLPSNNSFRSFSLKSRISLLIQNFVCLM